MTAGFHFDKSLRIPSNGPSSADNADVISAIIIMLPWLSLAGYLQGFDPR